MTQPFADALTWVPRTRAFGATLAQANDLARAQSHAAVTLEHLLLALVEDADAVPIFDACKISRAKLANSVQEQLDSLPQSDQAVPSADPALVKIVEYAAAAAQQSGRREVSGAIVLAAMVGDGASTAAKLLKASGLTFQDAVKALQSGAGQRPPPAIAASGGNAPAPPPPPSVDTAAIVTEDALTTARQRVAAARSQPPTTPALAGKATDATAQDAHPARRPPKSMEHLPPPVPQPPSDTGTSDEPENEQKDPLLDLSRLDDVAPSPETTNGWAPPPLPPPAATRNSRLPPPIPPLPGPQPRAQVAPISSEAKPAAASRPIARPPWDEAIIPVPAPPAPEPARPFDPTPLVDAIPERMRAGLAETIEIRIPRAEIMALGSSASATPLGMTGEAFARKAISVRLRSKSGALTVEPLSPETQWIDRRTDSLSDEYVRWRWIVTPKRQGQDSLMLAVACRSVGTEGPASDTAFPEQIAEVAVAANIRLQLRRVGGWLLAACIGAITMKLADGFVSAGVTALARLAGL